MTLRPARSADLAALRRLFVELGTGDPAPPDAVWARMLPDLEVLEERGVVIGYHFVVGYTLRHLAVDPAHRRRGCGRLLLAAAKARVRRAGYDELELTVRADNAAARALYEAEGLAVVEEEVAGFHDRALRMTGPVPPLVPTC